MARMTEAHGVEAMTPGAWYEVRLDLPYGDEVCVGPRAAVLTPGRPFPLQVASLPLADGVTLAVADDGPVAPA